MRDDHIVITASLGYRDAPAAIRFLVAAFGFEEVRVYHGDTDDQVNYAELRWPGGGTVAVSSAAGYSISMAELKEKAGGSPLPFGVHIDVDDPDLLFARAVAAGATVVREPTDSDHGTRDFMVTDPEGLTWSFGTPLPNPIPGIPESPRYTRP